MEKSNLIVALLIDADNAPAKKIDFIMSELANYGSVMVRKIYGNWKDDRLKSWENVLLDYALAPVQQFDYTKGKNATDMAMTIDVMDLLFLNKVDVFCLVSSDCDFTPLAMRIKASGKQVIAACSKFLFLDNAQSRTAPTEQQVQRKTAQELKGDSTLMNLLRNSIADSCDEDGWADLQQIGRIIGNQSSFDSRNYGFAKLSDLVRAIDIFETKLSDNRSQLYIRDKRAKKSS